MQESRARQPTPSTSSAHTTPAAGQRIPGRCTSRCFYRWRQHTGAECIDGDIGEPAWWYWCTSNIDRVASLEWYNGPCAVLGQPKPNGFTAPECETPCVGQ